MDARYQNKLPREGTTSSASGESLRAASAARSPTYPGGAISADMGKRDSGEGYPKGKERHRAGEKRAVLWDGEMRPEKLKFVFEFRKGINSVKESIVPDGRISVLLMGLNRSPGDEPEVVHQLAYRSGSRVSQLRIGKIREQGDGIPYVSITCPLDVYQKLQEYNVAEAAALAAKVAAEEVEMDMAVEDSDVEGSTCSVDSVNSTSSRKRRQEGGDRPMAPVKRGRGRPPTTGKYVGLAKAKQALIQAEREEMELQAEREVEALASQSRSIRSARLSDAVSIEDGTTSAVALRDQIAASVATINKVAICTGNLKGTFTRALKEATAFIAEAVQQLGDRSASDETRLLAAENARLTSELTQLRKEMAELRQEVRASREVEALPAVPVGEARAALSPNLKEITATILRQVGVMLNARFEAMEHRLPPEEQLRPPLAADARSMEPDTPLIGPVSLSGKKKTFAQVAKSQVAQGSNVPGPSGPVPSTSTSKATARKKAAPAIQQPKKAAAPTATKKPKIRAPRTAAVVLTLQPSAAERGLTYLKVLTEAKAKIRLDDLGIQGLGFRQALTGARMLEVAGPDGEVQADALAAKLREILRPEDVEVSRPCKTVALRVHGLDDSVTAEDVMSAMAAKRGCTHEGLKAGEIRRDGSGLRTLWVRCPVAAANAVLADGKLVVGWAVAKVSALKPRPLLCYRCLQPGHVGVKCTAEVDATGLCFRCSGPGHRAAQCSAVPHCGTCAKDGKAAGHVVGSGNCFTAKPKPKKRAPRGKEAPHPSKAR